MSLELLVITLLAATGVSAAGWLKTAGRGRYVVPPARVLPLLVIVMGVDR